MAQDRKPVGVIGTGLMGMACAKRLLAAGFDVLGYDIDAAKLAALAALGGRAARSAAEIAGSCDRVVLAVLNTGQVEETIEGPGGLVASRPQDSLPLTAICVSTCDPDRITALAARLAGGRLRFVVAPVSGTASRRRAARRWDSSAASARRRTG